MKCRDTGNHLSLHTIRSLAIALSVGRICSQFSCRKHLQLVLAKFRNVLTPVIDGGTVNVQSVSQCFSAAKVINGVLGFHGRIMSLLTVSCKSYARAHFFLDLICELAHSPSPCNTASNRKAEWRRGRVSRVIPVPRQLQDAPPAVALAQRAPRTGKGRATPLASLLDARPRRVICDVHGGNHAIASYRPEHG